MGKLRPSVFDASSGRCADAINMRVPALSSHLHMASCHLNIAAHAAAQQKFTIPLVPQQLQLITA
jgi:hypothetical protein